jgi:hypothetical protein
MSKKVRRVIIADSGEALARLLDLLQRHCLLGQLHYRSWRRLNDLFRDAPRVGNLAVTFFISAADAQLNSALLILNRLIDRSRDTLSIRAFLRRVRGAARLFPHCPEGKVREEIAADEAALDGFDAAIKKIQSHRNEQFVHLSAGLLEPPFGVVAADSFTYDEILTLLTAIGAILNKYARCLRNDELWMQFVGEERDFKYVVELLSRGAADQGVDGFAKDDE